MNSRSMIGLAATVLAMVPAGASAAPKAGLEGDACVRGDAATAAVGLYGNGTDLVREEKVAGLRTALVLEPYVAPGTRHRMVFVGGGWCDAEAGLNVAFRETGRKVGSGRAIAAAYARLAAAPYFDGVRVVSHRTVAGTHRIVTQARTNGVRAEWVVVTDASGVRTAKWLSTKIGTGAFVADFEGLTALPGARERYTRAAGGILNAVRGLPKSGGAPVRAPGAELSYTTPDNFKIVFSIADSQVAPEPGQDVGNEEADFARDLRDIVGENQEEFFRWGFRSEWSPAKISVGLVRLPLESELRGTGYVYINDSTSAYCFACVFIADDYNIHVISKVELILEALGYNYPPDKRREAFSDVMGHEIFHNYQNSYVKPEATGRRTQSFYSEGTARFQETLHSYSEISHQPKSLVYANDANGCNGFHDSDPSVTMAGGPFAQSYSACNFYLTFYGTFGMDAFRKLVAEGVPQGAGEFKDDQQAKILRGVEIATGKSMVEASAGWARGIITGKSLTFGSPLGGPAYDWGKFLERWVPEALAVGGVKEETLGAGGITAVEVTEAVRPTVAGDPAVPGEPGLAVLRDAPSGATLTFPASGDYVFGPAAGERVYVMAARPAVKDEKVKLSLGVAGPPPEPPVAPAPTTVPPKGGDGAGSTQSTGAKAVKVTCARAGKALRCRVSGLTGKSIAATLSRGKRILARGKARVRSGKATLRLTGSRKVAAGKATLTLKSGAKTVLKRTIRIKR